MKQMKTLFLILAAFVAITSQSREYVQKPVKITVYFDTEAACAACSSLLFDQLFPTYSDLGEAMTVDLVPYGTATQTTWYDGSISFDCGRYKAMGCVDKKIHACAIKTFGPWPGKNLCFLWCSLRDPRNAGKCALRHGMNHLAMAACVNSVEGDWLLAGYAEQTKQLGVPVNATTIPIVTVNGVYNETEQVMARSNLLHLVCSHLKVATHPPSGPSHSRMTSWTNGRGELLDYPSVCQEIRAKHTMTHKNYGSDYVYRNNQMGCLRENEI